MMEEDHDEKGELLKMAKQLKKKKRSSATSGNVEVEAARRPQQQLRVAPFDVSAVAGNATSYLKQVAYTLGNAEILKLDDYIPEFVKNYAAGGSSYREQALARDRILFVKFQRATIFGRGDPSTASTGWESLFLLVGYMDGFQIWNVSDGNVAREVVCVRDVGPVWLASLLTDSGEKPLSSFDHSTGEQGIEGESSNCNNTAPQATRIDSLRPLVACAVADDNTPNFPPNVVKFYSLKTNKFAHRLSFEGKVIGIESNKKFVAIALRNKIVGFSANTLEHRFLIDLSLPMNDGAVFALSARWIAYPVREAPEVGEEKKESSAQQNGLSLDRNQQKEWTSTVTNAAKDIAAGLYYLGDLGLKKLDKQQQQQQQQQHHDKQQQSDSGKAMSNSSSSSSLSSLSQHAKVGTIIVRDLVTNATVAHFQSHSSPTTLLEFDPTGSLLVSGTAEGQVLHVHRIQPRSEGGHIAPTQRLLYRINRGITHAVIRSVTFSQDLRWLAVTSARGTTHIFAISPSGGPVSTFTHPTSNIGKDEQTKWSLREKFASLSSSLSTKGSLSPSTLSTSFGSHSSHGSSSYAETSPLSNGTVSTNGEMRRVLPVVPNVSKLSSSDEDVPTCTLNAVARVRQRLHGLLLGGSSSSPREGFESHLIDSHGQHKTIPSAVHAVFRGSFLLVTSSCGLIEEYELVPSVSEKDKKDLALHTASTRCWDIARHKTDGEFKEPIEKNKYIYPQPTTLQHHNHHHKSNKNHSNPSKRHPNDQTEEERRRSKWLANAEILTHEPPLTHVWAAPQFRFGTYTDNAKPLFAEKHGISIIPIRGDGPVPVFTSNGGNAHKNSKKKNSNKKQQPLDELQHAIATPGTFQDLFIADDQDLDQHILIFDDDDDDDHHHNHHHHQQQQQQQQQHQQDEDEDDELPLIDFDEHDFQFEHDIKDIVDEDGFVVPAQRPKSD